PVRDWVAGGGPLLARPRVVRLARGVARRGHLRHPGPALELRDSGVRGPAGDRVHRLGRRARGQAAAPGLASARAAGIRRTAAAGGLAVHRRLLALALPVTRLAGADPARGPRGG